MMLKKDILRAQSLNVPLFTDPGWYEPLRVQIERDCGRGKWHCLCTTTEGRQFNRYVTSAELKASVPDDVQFAEPEKYFDTLVQLGNESESQKCVEEFNVFQLPDGKLVLKQQIRRGWGDQDYRVDYSIADWVCVCRDGEDLFDSDVTDRQVLPRFELDPEVPAHFAQCISTRYGNDLWPEPPQTRTISDDWRVSMDMEVTVQ